MIHSVLKQAPRIAMGSSRFFSVAKKTFVLEYHYVENMLEKRAPFRSSHLQYAQQSVDKKILLAGGALVPEVKRGILLLRADHEQAVRDFAQNDPYVKNGLITKFDISEWAVAIGSV